jgi:hypothetical protein
MTETAKHDPTKTRQGFIKAQYITNDQAAAIIALISEGMREGSACRKHGTSYTQFLRKTKGTPLEAELRLAEKQRRDAGVQSADA